MVSMLTVKLIFLGHRGDCTGLQAIMDAVSPTKSLENVTFLVEGSDYTPASQMTLLMTEDSYAYFGKSIGSNCKNLSTIGRYIQSLNYRY